MVEIGPYAKVNPPIRAEEERIRLGQHLKSGAIDTTGSDHAPHSYVTIEQDWGDMMAAPGDSPGLEMILLFLLTQMRAIGGVKRYRIVKDKIRNWKNDFRDKVMETRSGLHNFRLSFRPWQYEAV